MSGLSTVTRFAPSPTGELHLGNVRTALFNFLLARRAGGRFVLRIEDTDADRSNVVFTEALIAELRGFGLDWDEGPDVGGHAAPYRQSERGALYAAAFARLIAAGLAYPCYCTANELELSRRAQLAAGKPPRYAGTCRDLDAPARAEREARGLAPALRFRVPADAAITFDDFVHGPQTFHGVDLGDFIIRRHDGSAAFFFSNALDDALMGVTHVLRGEDHLANTPRQLLLLGALGHAPPRYGHVALLVGADGAKLSKRHGATTLRDLRERGYLAGAIRNHLYRLGHSTPLTGWLERDAMVQAFDVAHLGRAPARFDMVQLDVWQKDAVHRLTGAEFARWAGDALPAGLASASIAAFIAAVQPNVLFPADVRDWAAVVFGESPPLTDAAAAVVRAAGQPFFVAAAAAAGESGNDLAAMANAIRAATGARGPALYKPLRLALTGRDHGPELAPLLRAMPRAAARERLLRFAGAAP